MEDIKDQVDKLKEAWASVYDGLKSSPAAIASHLNGANLEQINEVVDTVANLIKRVRAPKGFQPSFHLARAVALTALPTAQSSVAALQRGEYAHFSPFIASLNQMVSALHSLLALADQREAIASLAGELAEKLSLLDTAQSELKRKADSLAEADGMAQKIEESHGAMVTLLEEAASLSEKLKAFEKSAEEDANAIDEHEQKFDALETSINELLTIAQKLQKELETKRAELGKLTELADQQHKTIAGLLPRAASAGLAHSFSERVVVMERTKWIWLGVFFISILGLIGTGFWITQIITGNSQVPLWEALLHKLPLLAPLVWLGWFSAIQYGNSLRVQEDYAFKEATSKAFQGYRDHMEHLKSVDAEGADNALALLSAKTIDVLSKEPLRVFQKNERDASPSQAIKDLILRRDTKND